MQPDDHPNAETPPPEPSPLDAPAGVSPPRGTLSGGAPSAASRWRERLGPLWQQTWCNLRVWLPGLANPDFRDREVIYAARESRKVSEWQIALPERCWQCEATDDLSHTEIREMVRSFEFALYIFAGGLTASLVLALLALWIGSWFTAFLALASVAVTAGLLWLKSWPESIRVAIWNCPQHDAAEAKVEMVVDDAELHLFLPNRCIATHAREELKKSRRSRSTYDTDAGPGAAVRPRPSSGDDEATLPLSTDVPGTSRYVSPHRTTPLPAADLSPIQLDEGPLQADEGEADDNTPTSTPPGDSVCPDSDESAT